MHEVLALKYRPKNFDSLIGQDSITQTLSLALTNQRLSYAYLFSGLRGSGKTSTARIFSKALVCDHGPTKSPCEVCQNCIMANENRHIDIIEMDAASSRKIDDIRDVIEQTKYKPNIARFKIFIIDEVHMLTREAFNALLKTLEEPPEFVKFILATTDPLKLPATILSRTQHFRFKQIPHEDIVHHLTYILNEEKISFEIDALSMISRAGHGSLRDSLTLLDQAIIFSNSNITSLKIADMLGLLDTKKLDEIFDAIFNEDKKRILEFIKELESYECEVVIDELIAYIKQKFYANDTQFSMLLTERFFRILSEAKQLLFINADNGFVLGLVFFKMLEAMNIKRIDKLIHSLEKEKFRTQQVTHIDQTDKIIQIPTKIAPQPTKNEIQIPIEEKRIDERFSKLVSELGSRNYELGECFQKHISFVSFDENTLCLKSTANDECRQTLRHTYGIIKQFVREIFGKDTKISVEQIDLNQDLKKKSIIDEIKHEITKNNDKNHKEDIKNTLHDTTLNNEQIEIQEIMKTDFLKQAQELFKPKRIKILPK